MDTDGCAGAAADQSQAADGHRGAIRDRSGRSHEGSYRFGVQGTVFLPSFWDMPRSMASWHVLWWPG